MEHGGSIGGKQGGFGAKETMGALWDTHPINKKSYVKKYQKIQ